MSDRLKSRKLWALIGLVLLVIGNYVFTLGMPPSDVLYLVILGASYILGQGFVDANQQPVKDFPVDAVSQSVTNIIQSELSKTGFGKNLPMEDILDMLKNLMHQELGKLSFTVTTPVSPVIPADPQPVAETPTV